MQIPQTRGAPSAQNKKLTVANKAKQPAACWTPKSP